MLMGGLIPDRKKTLHGQAAYKGKLVFLVPGVASFRVFTLDSASTSDGDGSGIVEILEVPYSYGGPIPRDAPEFSAHVCGGRWYVALDNERPGAYVVDLDAGALKS